MTNPYAPVGESSADLWLEKSNLIGAVLGGVAYGAHIAVYAECVYRMNQQGLTDNVARRRSYWLLAFISMLFAMGTVNLACNTKMTELMFIDNRGYPGGPNSWFFAYYSEGVNTAGNVSYIVANFLADGLLLWRVYVIWNTIWIILFPFIMYLGSTAMSIMVIFQASRPNASLWTSTTVQFTLPYFVISISLNVSLTLLLVGRLLYMSHNLKKTLGKDSEHGQAYISIATMLIESATPYAVTAIIFIITYGRNSNVQNLVLPVLSQIMCISPEVIILRVATGRAVSTKRGTLATGAVTTGIRFHVPRVEESSRSFALASIAPSVGTGNTGSATLGSTPNLLKEKEDV